MDLREAATAWNEIGRLDPCWAVLVEPSRKHGGWETEDGKFEFFRTGEEEIAAVLALLRSLAVRVGSDRALDFGCGVGRLTRALAARFAHCDGVDISAAMVERARELNDEHPRCLFHVNAVADLKLFEAASFDLVYSSIVLQHVPSREAIERYISEFVRVLRPSGVAVFQLPSHIPLKRRIQPRRRLYGWLRKIGIVPEVLYGSLGLVPIRMNFVPERRVLEVLKAAGAEILAVRSNAAAGPEIESRLYVARKPERSGDTAHAPQ